MSACYCSHGSGYVSMFAYYYSHGYGYGSMSVYWIWICPMDLDIITYRDLDMVPCPHMTAQSGYSSMSAYYCSHGYGYDSMSTYLSL